MVSQTQPALLAGTFIVCDILPCVLWNLNQLWLRLTPVLSDWRQMYGFVFENVRNWCLFHYKNLVRPVRPYHWGTLTQLPVTHLLHNASGWQARAPLWVATIPSTVNTAQNIRDFALWYSRFSVDCLLAAPMVVGAAFLMLKCISSYLDCQYDNLSIDKCGKIGHRGPRCEEMLTNEEFIMKKKILCPQW